ncbi:MAG: glycine oxidase ThiO [Actinomycetota bacterium]
MTDLLVVGGGTIGLGIAWRAARAGLSVTVLDRRPASGASSVAAGMLAPVTELHYGEEALLRLNLDSSELYPGWVAELEEASGLSTGYRSSGTLMIARDTDDNVALEEVFRFQESLGLQVERLSARECRRLEPALAPSVRGGIHVEGDHQVEPRALLDALQRACERAGVVTIERQGVELMRLPERVTGVRTDDGQVLGASAIVLAMGAWTPLLEGVPEGLLPVRPVKGQLLHLTPLDDPTPLQRNLRGADVYMVPRADGRLVVGATVEERGFDTTVTAGAVYTLLRDAYELVPSVIEMELSATISALRPGTPDNAPLIGPADLPGLFIATGHFRNGILLTPVTAEAAVGWLADGDVDERIAPFSPERFAAEQAAPL